MWFGKGDHNLTFLKKNNGKEFNSSCYLLLSWSCPWEHTGWWVDKKKLFSSFYIFGPPTGGAQKIYGVGTIHTRLYLERLKKVQNIFRTNLLAIRENKKWGVSERAPITFSTPYDAQFKHIVKIIKKKKLPLLQLQENVQEILKA